jgi:hypothetical protein
MAVRLAMGDAPSDTLIARPGFYWVYFDEWAKERFMPWRNSFLRQLRNGSNTASIFNIGDRKPELMHIAQISRLKFKRLLRR